MCKNFLKRQSSENISCSRVILARYVLLSSWCPIFLPWFSYISNCKFGKTQEHTVGTRFFWSFIIQNVWLYWRKVPWLLPSVDLTFSMVRIWCFLGMLFFALFAFNGSFLRNKFLEFHFVGTNLMSQGHTFWSIKTTGELV